MAEERRRLGKALSALLVRSDLAPGKYHDGGGLGLYLRVDANRAKFWVQRITIQGGRRELGLGSPPLTTLAAVRERATENKRLVLTGGDPRAGKRRAREALTFGDAMERYLAGKLAEFRNEKHRKQWRATLDTYAIPKIGAKAVGDVDVADMLRVLQPIWSEKTETASRLRGRIEAVLSWATVSGHRTGDNPARWAGNLAELLPKPTRVAVSGNQPALALIDVPRWWAALCQREGKAAQALQFLAMTAARSGEVRGMTWSELDILTRSDANHAIPATWTVPAARMKAGREHRVPLTEEAVALLERQPRMDGNPFVFFAPGGGALSDMSISAVMRRMQADEENVGRVGFLDPRSGRAAVPHGLRSTFRDWAAEVGADRDMAEMALAHHVGDAVERAYRRSDMLERRRALLAAWGRFIRGDDRVESEPTEGGTRHG